MTYIIKLNPWFDSSLQRQCCSWGDCVDIKFTPLSWALIFKSVTITSRSWSFSKSTIWLCVTHWATGTNSRQTIEYNLFQVHNLPPLVCNNIRLMVCLGLGRIEQGGHPVLDWAARETPGKERAAGRGLKIQKSTWGGAQHQDWGPLRDWIYNNPQSTLKILIFTITIY